MPSDPTDWRAEKEARDFKSGASEIVRFGFDRLRVKREEADAGKIPRSTGSVRLSDDEMQFLAVVGLYRKAIDVILVGEERAVVKGTIPPSKTIRLKNGKEVTTLSHTKTVYVSRYKDTGPLMKIVALTYEASFMSNPSAFSLNLSTDVVTSANSSGNFVAYIHDRLSRHLKPIYTTLGLDCEFFFWVEVTSDDINTAHLHGVIGLPPGARSGLALYSKVRKAMKKAGGEGWTPHATERQVDLRSLWGPQGWGGYIAKRRRFTSWVIKDHRLMSATKKLRTRAGERYDSARRSGEILTGFVRH